MYSHSPHIYLFDDTRLTVKMAAPPDTSSTDKSVVQPTGASGASSRSVLDPEFVAVILASTAGTRLFPLTSEGDDESDDEFDALPQEPDEGEEEDGDGDANAAVMAGSGDMTAQADSSNNDDDPTVPKHLLPVAGTSILRRLLGSVATAGFVKCVVAVSASDNGLTAKTLLSDGSGISRISDNLLRMEAGNAGSSSGSSSSGGGAKRGKKSSDGSSNASMEVSIISLDSNCGGSADAIRHLSTVGAIPSSSHLVVMPGDLVLGSSLGDGGTLRLLADAHRRGQEPSEVSTTASVFSPPACTLLLSDVGDEDENGVPLKESAKVSIYAIMCKHYPVIMEPDTDMTVA